MKYTFLIYLLLIFSFCNAQINITNSEIYKHIKFLSSDSLKGRFPGTAEDKIAANYILNDLKSSGCKAIGESGFQYFTVSTGITLGQNNYMNIDSFEVELGSDYIPRSYSLSGNCNSEVVFVGYGFDVKKDSLQWNDYQNIDVTGKWVLILRDIPNTKYPNELFLNQANDRLKALNAQNKGAAGVIFVSGYQLSGKDELTEFLLSRIPGNIDIRVIDVKREIAEKIFSGSGFSLKEIETQIKKNNKPISIFLKTKVNVSVEIITQKSETQNIVTVIEGSDEKLKNRYIVLGAHYDHIGFGGHESGSRMEDSIAIHNGADDNASGVAAILEIAEKLNLDSKKTKRSIVIIAFGAEEKRMVGSKYFVENQIISTDSIDCMLNIDMIGRYNRETGMNIYGVGTTEIFSKIIDKNFKKSNLKYVTAKDSYGGSDHVSFKNIEIPVMVFNTGGHDDYHTPKDDIEYINSKKEAQICKKIYKVILEIANSNSNFAFLTDY